MNLLYELWLQLTVECLACKLCQYDIIKLVINNDGRWTQMFVYWAFIAKVTVTNLLKILFPCESFTSSVHVSIIYSSAACNSHQFLLTLCRDHASLASWPIVFHSAFKPPEKGCIKKWPIFNCIELWNASCRFLLI